MPFYSILLKTFEFGKQHPVNLKSEKIEVFLSVNKWFDFKNLSTLIFCNVQLNDKNSSISEVAQLKSENLKLLVLLSKYR